MSRVELRRTLIVAAVIIAVMLASALYVLVFVMSGGVHSIPLGGGPGALELHFANAAFLILLMLPVIGAVIWLLRAPEKFAMMARRKRTERGLEALENALIASAAGDSRTARREARRAEEHLSRGVASRLVSAQAAEQMGDVVGAESHYAAMLADHRTEMVGRRGLAAAALERRDLQTAILHAAQAFAASPNTRWAFDLLFDAHVRAAQWEDALETLAQGLKRRHLTEVAARRRRAVLLAAKASAVEMSDPSRARELAEQAASLSPAFAPAAALAARLLLTAGKQWRAASLLEEAWSAAPHPALALAYRDLKVDESDAARAKRMKGLADLNPEHRESRIVLAEQALALGSGDVAKEALAPIVETEREPSARLCGLLAQVAQACGEVEKAREWVRSATLAPGEPDWSDLDPEGPAFAYYDEDWARLVFTFGDTGRLIHPRHERYERPRLTAPSELLLEAPEEEVVADHVVAAAPDAVKASAEAAKAPSPVPPHLPDDPGIAGAKRS